MKLTEAEWKVMNAVWKRHPASARDVVERLEGKADWAYTTVKTMLTRLEEKGALKSRMRAKMALYEPVLSRAKARHAALRSLMDSAFDGAFGPMMQFLVSRKDLSEEDRVEVLRMLEDENNKHEAKGERK